LALYSYAIIRACGTLDGSGSPTASGYRTLMGPRLLRVIRIILGVHAVESDDTYI
jgi:hypothetical protein